MRPRAWHLSVPPRRASEPDFGRRRVMMAASACATALVLPKTFAQAASCAVTENAGEGPFYFDPSLVRSDVTSGRPGAPLEFAVQITRASDCAPLPGVRLDLWQADALGLYSGYLDQPGVGGVPTAPTVGATFLRGTQLADAAGWVRFKTVYPSWYGGRTPHIHFKVLIDATERIASQVFFPDEVNAEVFENWDPYREHRAKRTSFNHNDTFLDRNKDGRTDGVFCDVERVDRSGLAAKAVVTIDV
jgi:protocatechuate 3,4-dioxygenase beta subunit